MQERMDGSLKNNAEIPIPSRCKSDEEEEVEEELVVAPTKKVIPTIHLTDIEEAPDLRYYRNAYTRYHPDDAAKPIAEQRVTAIELGASNCQWSEFNMIVSIEIDLVWLRVDPFYDIRTSKSPLRWNRNNAASGDGAHSKSALTSTRMDVVYFKQLHPRVFWMDFLHRLLYTIDTGMIGMIRDFTAMRVVNTWRTCSDSSITRSNSWRPGTHYRSTRVRC
jgi:hypothetical protein